MNANFLRRLADDLCRLLSPRGFQGSDLEYRKQRGHVISCLAIQEHSSEPLCCVNLGVHLDFVPVVGGNDIAPLQMMTVTHCEIRRRLTPHPEMEDFWWRYDDADAPKELTTVLEDWGFPFFSRIEKFPDYWTSVSLKNLRDGSFATMLPGMTRVRAALLLARVHAFVGDMDKCQEFALYGLEIAPVVAIGPKRSLTQLLAQKPDS